MANNLHISYDLHQPDRNYSEVMTRIKELGSWAKIELSFFFVSSAYTATQARDHIWQSMHVGDKLYVVDASNNNAAWRGVNQEASDFIKNNWNT